MKHHPKEDRTLAGLCFSAALALGFTALYLLFTPGRYFVVAFLGLSLVLFFMGRQRLTKYRMNALRFQKLTRNLGIFIALAFLAGGVITIAG